jgi:hypothetical protein
MNENPTIREWLEGGHMREALEGQGEYFLADPTYRQCHNVLLVVQEILDWAQDTRLVSECGREFTVAVNAIAVANPVRALDTLLAYAIASRDVKTRLPVDFNLVDKTLAVGVRQGAIKDIVQVRRLGQQVHKRLPVLTALTDSLRE